MISVDFGNDGFSIQCELCVEGDKWCVMMVGQHFSISPSGFGHTVSDAVSNFKMAVRNELTPKLKKDDSAEFDRW